MRLTPHLLLSPSLRSLYATHSPRTPMALLPPIPLYRRILRAHRKFLPSKEMRVLGDEYVKAEFRLHREIENPVHIVGFLTEWQSYVQQVEGDKWRGERMDRGKVEKMSDEQVAQMYELMVSIRKRELEGEGEDGEGEFEYGKVPDVPSPRGKDG